MRYLSRLKGIKTRTKIGLASSIVYCSASLALPAFANTNTAIQPINVEQITTAQQAETLYQQKLEAYAGDKKIDSQEVRNLYKIQEVRKDLLEKQRESLVEEYLEKETETKSISSRIKVYQEKLKAEGHVLNQTKDKLEKNILKYYPSLINKEKGNLVYSADTSLESELNSVFRSIALEADRILKEHYQDNSVELLAKKKEYTLNNVLALYTILTAKRENVYLDKDLKEKLTKDIFGLEKKRDHVFKKTTSIREELYSIDDWRATNSEIITRFQEYNDFKKEIEEFKEKYGDFNNQPFMSLLADNILRKKTGLNRREKQRGFERKQEEIKSGLEAYIRENTSFDVEVELPKNPTDFMFPRMFGVCFGILFPMVRNGLIKAYMRGPDAREEEWVGSFFAGMGNGFAGLFLLDGLHPLVWPIRMCSPLIFQPIFKILKWHPLES